MAIASGWVLATGILGQLLFSARILVQWLHAEKARRPVSPVLFWQLSLLGSAVFFAYGVLRRDFAIVFGQLLVYWVYIANLDLLRRWLPVPRVLRWAVYLLPATSLAFLLSTAPGNLRDLLGNEAVPAPLLVWGTLGQLVLSLRFFVQWLDSRRTGESILSARFWTFSFAGSLMIMLYAVLRADPVLLAGQLFGCVAYARNLALARGA